MEKRKKILLSYLMVIFLIAISLLPAKKVFADDQKPYEGKVVILHSNDVHGSIDGYPVMKALADDYESKGADVFLVDAGDFAQGNAYAFYSKGKDEALLMKMTGYDVGIVGNHEFDYGIDYVQELMEYLQTSEPTGEEGVAVTSCNILRDGSQIFDSSTIIEADGLKIGFIGVETPEALTKSNPAINKGLGVIQGEELNNKVNAEATSLKENGCDIVIVIAHLGVDKASEPNRSLDLWDNIENVDFIIDGHSHTEMTEGPEGQPIQSTGSNFKNIGIIEIDKESKQISANSLYKVTEESPKDAVVAEKVAKIEEKVRQEYGTVIGNSEVELNGNKAPGNRTEETNHGDFTTDAYVWYLIEKNPGSIKEGVPVIAIENGGGIRASIPQGDVTKQKVLNVHPFNNTLSVVYVTGEELLEALEASTFSTPEAAGGFPQVAGMKYKVNIAKPYDPAPETYPGSTYYPPKSIQRVTIQEVGGQPFDPEQEYAIITTDFVANGGDTYYIFKASDNKFDTGFDCAQIVIEYISEKLNGVIPAELYEKPMGRIQIVNEEEPQPKPEPIPKTADSNNEWILVIILSVSALSLIGSCIAKNNRNNF